MLSSLKYRSGSFLLCIVFALYAAYLVTALTLPEIEKPIAGLLMLVGWVGLYRLKNHFYRLGSTEKYVLYSFALFTVISIISFLVMPKSRVGQMHLEDYGVFLMIIPLYLLLRQFRINLTVFLLVISVVLIGLGVQSYLSISTRPSGGVNAMRFANVTLIMSFFLMVAFVVLKSPTKRAKSMLVLASCFGLFACLMAQSRGALLSIPVLVFAYSIYLYRKGDSRIFLMVILLGLVSLAFLSQQSRVQKTFSSVEEYFEGDSRSALGARFDMFKAAFILIKEKPVFGHGLGSYPVEASKIRVRIPSMNYEVGLWNNPHNEILLVMVEKGVIGLVTLVLVFWAPAYFFWQALRRSSRFKNNAVIKFYSVSGLGLLLVYMVAGQSVALFEHDVFNHFYILMVILFVSQIRAHEHYSGLGK